MEVFDLAYLHLMTDMLVKYDIPVILDRIQIQIADNTADQDVYLPYKQAGS